jgi:cytochrome oxidase Cu insertion factor (SCO1/SenC/PrrC family)
MQSSVRRWPPLALRIGALLLSLLIGGAAVALLLRRADAPAPAGAAVPIAPAPGFTLTDQLGRPVGDADLRGKDGHAAQPPR